jgi:hypothetical protein
MRAIAIDRYGGPQVLTLHELPVPQLGPTEVLISVHPQEWEDGMPTSAAVGLPAAAASVFHWS